MELSKLLEEYRKMPKEIIEDLHYLTAIRECYDCKQNFSDEIILSIIDLAHDCWLDDEYSKGSISDYANYISNGVLENELTKKEIDDLDVYSVVEAFNNEDDFENLLKFDDEDYEFCFRTIDGNKYYQNNDGITIVDSKDRLISKPHPMSDPFDDIFDLLEKKQITYMPLSMHYNIRCMIINDIEPDNELKKQYQKGIENYQKYCEEKYITSKDILNAVKHNNNIDLFSIDNLYTAKNKLNRLEMYNGKKYNNYSYVASLSNGTDYFYNDGLYLALDKNGITKFFDDEKLFLLKELKDKIHFAYISNDESKKIANEITEEYKSEIKNNKDSFIRKNRDLYSLSNFLKYEKDKELNSFTDKSLPLLLSLQISTSEMAKEGFKNKINQTMDQKQKNNIKDIEI